jgi:hypothetical protein
MDIHISNAALICITICITICVIGVDIIRDHKAK